MLKNNVKLTLIPMIFCVLFFSVAGPAFATPAGQDVTLPNGLVIDRWMLQSDGQTVANCLGQTFSQYGNKTMQEMVNFIYVDPYAASASDAQNRFFEAVDAANPPFDTSVWHTGGYTSYIEDTLYQQQPASPYGAFADKSFYESNIHHFRTWGPYLYQGAWYTIVATSTESYIWYEFTHVWVSFNSARDTLLSGLLTSPIDPGFVQLASVNLQNQIPTSNPTLTTGDFDGVTVVVQSPAAINMDPD